jgi:hypothetical protein
MQLSIYYLLDSNWNWDLLNEKTTNAGPHNKISSVVVPKARK